MDRIKTRQKKLRNATIYGREARVGDRAAGEQERHLPWLRIEVS